MIQISDISKIIEEQKNELDQIKIDQKSKRITIDLNAKDFKELFLVLVNKIIAGRGIDREFEMTAINTKIINQFYYYLTANEEMFKGDLNKGILLVGTNGVGKTLILKAYCDMVGILSRKNIHQIHSKQLLENIVKDGTLAYEKKPLFIDDIGKETRVVNNFGTKAEPIIDLMSIRYDNGATTFATGNFKLETFAELYGKTISDRFKEMFNFIHLEGESFRK